MDFLTAIAHAVIGYGIRRKVWVKDVVLTASVAPAGRTRLYWIGDLDGSGKKSPEQFGRSKDSPAELLGPSPTWDITITDITSTDWEVIAG